MGEEGGASFDHLVGDGEHAWRNRQAERPGGVEVNDKLKLGRLHDWQVGRLLALENPAGIDAGLVIRIGRFSATAMAGEGASPRFTACHRRFHCSAIAHASGPSWPHGTE